MHCPDMVLHNGTTQTSAQFIIDHDKDEAKRDAERKYLESVPSHLRSFEEAVSYIQIKFILAMKDQRFLLI